MVATSGQSALAGAWFTLTEAAAATGKSRSTIKKYLADDRFPQAQQGRRRGQLVWVIPLVDLLAAGLTPNAPQDCERRRRPAGRGGTQGGRLAEVEAELAELRVRAQVAEVRAETAERLIRQQAEHVGDLRRALLMLEAGTSNTAESSPEREQAQAPLTRRVEKRPRRWPWRC